MKRYAENILCEWKTRLDRKSLIIRGARQVGKSYLVRKFGEQQFDSMIEINFEINAWAEDLFGEKSPTDIVAFLEAKYNQPIIKGRTLLFLDEIQAAPQALITLRYFYEQMPELHVIAAGSLLDFVLRDHVFSMPVGRIEYLHLGPMSFEEFLLATDKNIKLQRLESFSIDEEFSKHLHQSLMEDFRQYCVIGGMPGAIAAYLENNSYLDVQRCQESILATYMDDFSKYSSKVEHSLLRRIFARIPMLAGRKIKYTHVDPNQRSKKVADAIELLELAKIITRIVHTSANGIPLGAEVNERDFKMLFLDVGLLCRACRLDMTDILSAADLMLINSGAICEQFIGQHLLYEVPPYQQPELYCWIRQKAGTSSEVDFVIQQGVLIVPIEVKAGKTGRLKSIHVFISEKHQNFALRFNADVSSIVDTTTVVPKRESEPFRLLSLPLYMVGQTKRLIKEAMLNVK